MSETILMDKRGARWIMAPDYQTDRPGERGYAVLESDRGEREAYEFIMELYGFRDGRVIGDRPYLIGYLAELDEVRLIASVRHPEVRS